MLCFGECSRSWERMKPGQLTETDQSDIPCCMVPCSAIKAGGKEGWEETFKVMRFVFPVNRYIWWALVSWKWLNIYLPTGSTKLICSAWTAFPLSVKQLLCQPMSFHIFFFWLQSPHYCMRSEQVTVWYLTTRVEPQHIRKKRINVDLVFFTHN